MGAEGSPKETPAPRKAPQVVVGGSKAASPTETTHQGERALETALGILEHIHTLRLQTLHDMGGMRELKQTVVCTLMAEFARLQLILGEDLTRSLSALHSELETSSEALSSDLLSVLNLHSGDPAFPWVKELIQKHQQSISMKVNLPMMELEAAREDLGGFLQKRLHKLNSGDGRGTLLDTIDLCQQGMRGHPGPWDRGASRVQSSYARASRGPASRSYSLPRNPGWVVWEAWLDASRCS